MPDITEHKSEQEIHLSVPEERSDILVREAYHRIKNNLQGIAGLLRQHVLKHPEVKDVLEGAIAQICSIATVHDLYCSGSHRCLQLFDMVERIGVAAMDMTNTDIRFVIENNVGLPPTLDRREDLSVTLIINELIFNAIKHGHSALSKSGVLITCKYDGRHATVTTTNFGTCLPEDFDFNAGTGLGTGLYLVKSLLPPKGASLKFENRKDGVSTILVLSEPVLGEPLSN